MKTTMGTGAAATALALLLALGAKAARADADGAVLTPQNASKVVQEAALEGHKMGVFGLAFGPDGRRLASASVDKTVRLWDVATHEQAALLEGHTMTVACVGFRADGASVVSGGYEPAVRVWEASTGKLLETQEKNPADVSQRVRLDTLNCALSPDGSLLVSTRDLGLQIDVWDVKSRAGRALALPASKTLSHARRVAFSGDGRWLAVQIDRESAGATVELYDLEARRWGATLSASAGALVAGEALAVSADGSKVASVDVHSSGIHVWDAKSGAALQALKGHVHDADSEQTLIAGMAFSPDGRLLASASYDKTIRLWDLETGKEAASLASHGSGATAVVFSPDGRRLASADLEGTVQLWIVPGS